MTFVYDTYSLFSRVEARIAALRRGLGIYCLDIEVHFTPNDMRDGTFVVNGLHVGIEFGNEKQAMGMAHPVPAEFSNTESFVVVATGQPEQRRLFRSYLSPSTLEGLETARNGSDAVFQLTVCGSIAAFAAQERMNPQRGYHTAFLRVPQSEWGKLLDEAGYQKSIFFEMGLSNAEEFGAAANHVRDAQNAFVQGRYSDVVARCRDALDSVISNADCPWREAAKRESREKMSVEDTFRLSWCAIRQITHATHHRNSLKAEFTRPMAHYVLGATCLALSLASKERELFVRPAAMESDGGAVR